MTLSQVLLSCKSPVQMVTTAPPLVIRIKKSLAASLFSHPTAKSQDHRIIKVARGLGKSNSAQSWVSLEIRPDSSGVYSHTSTPWMEAAQPCWATSSNAWLVLPWQNYSWTSPAPVPTVSCPHMMHHQEVESVASSSVSPTGMGRLLLGFLKTVSALCWASQVSSVYPHREGTPAPDLCWTSSSSFSAVTCQTGRLQPAWRQGLAPLLVQDFAVVLVGFHEASAGSFLHPVQVSPHSSPVLKTYWLQPSSWWLSSLKTIYSTSSPGCW